MTVIMDETNTLITWPTRLKIGAKSKKDPHIKVVGRHIGVQTAKEKIMQILNTRSSRVTIKLDVSYTDHSHIIGKGGLTIKRVMEETGCHIHFPDSNRSNHQEKSNQVSIAGEMEGVEKARARVRHLTPLIFSFELPVMSSIQAPPDPTNPYIVKIQEKFNVQVMFRTRPKLYATLVLVKGCEWEVQQVKEATIFLMQQMCKSLANQIQVQMSMEISPQHHSVVLGKQNSNLKQIMQRTQTQIMFPDAGDPNIPSLKKSNVIITGAINNVYLARQQLIGSLPLVLMFDLPENSISSVDTDNISQLMQNLDVFINVRHKPKQCSVSVIVKGTERNASRIYEARRQLLGLDDPPVDAVIPVTYQIPSGGNVFLGNHNASTVTSGGLMGLPDNLSNLLTVNTHNPYGLSMPPSPSPMSLSPHSWGLPQISPMFSPLVPNPYPFPHATALLEATRQAMQANIYKQQQQAAQMQRNVGQNIFGDYLSLSSASSSLSSPDDSPRNASPIGNTENTSLDISTMLTDMSISERLNRKTLNLTSREQAQSTITAFDYEQKKISALKAMQSKVKSSEVRVPTPAWSGYGFSQTMPAAVSTTEGKQLEPNDLWDDPTTPLAYIPSMDFDMDDVKDSGLGIGMNSGYMDYVPGSKLEKIVSGPQNDLDTILAGIGMEKYIRVLKAHEVDMATFRSLTEKDLSEIGITAWGAKRKILLLIAELNKRTMTFSGSAAPGAERKSSLTNTTSNSGQCSSTTLDSKW